MSFLLYSTPYANIQTLTGENIQGNIYQLVASRNYLMGNIIILFAIFMMSAHVICGIFIGFKPNEKSYRYQRVFSIIETVMWASMILISMTAFHVGMVFMVLFSLSNAIALQKIKVLNFDQ